MRWAEIEAQWDHYGPQLKDRWGRLTEEDLAAARGGPDKLVGCVLKRYRVEADVAARHVDDWANSAG